MNYVVRDRVFNSYRQDRYNWTYDLSEAEIFKTKRCQKSWWFNSKDHELVPVKISLAETPE